jgi:hypothetical protein
MNSAEFIDPRFRENKPKTLVFSHRKRALWACFRENCVYNFGHRTLIDHFLIEIAIYLSLGLHKVRASCRRSLQPSKANIPALQNMTIFYFYFCGSFLPSWILIPDPDPLT